NLRSHRQGRAGHRAGRSRIVQRSGARTAIALPGRGTHEAAKTGGKAGRGLVDDGSNLVTNSFRCVSGSPGGTAQRSPARKRWGRRRGNPESPVRGGTESRSPVHEVFRFLFLLPVRRDGFGANRRSRRNIPCIEAALMIAPV